MTLAICTDNVGKGQDADYGQKAALHTSPSGKTWVQVQTVAPNWKRDTGQSSQPGDALSTQGNGSTQTRVVSDATTYEPGPYEQHSWNNGALGCDPLQGQTPAMAGFVRLAQGLPS